MGTMKDGIARIGKVIDHAIDKFRETILETRKGYNQTVFLYTPSGDDSVPCKNDKAIILKVDGTGNFIGVGILTESQGAKPGEKIFFGRDADGKITSTLSMLNNGDVKLENIGDAFQYTKGNREAVIDGDVIKQIKGNEKVKINNNKIEDIGGKFYFGNNTQNAAKLLIGLIDEIINLETFGPPSRHRVMPNAILRLEAYKDQVKALYKEDT